MTKTPLVERENEKLPATLNRKSIFRSTLIIRTVLCRYSMEQGDLSNFIWCAECWVAIISRTHFSTRNCAGISPSVFLPDLPLASPKDEHFSLPREGENSGISTLNVLNESDGKIVAVEYMQPFNYSYRKVFTPWK